MPSPRIATLYDAVEKLYQLHIGVTGTAGEWHERPHKPVLLLGVPGQRVTESEAAN